MLRRTLRVAAACAAVTLVTGCVMSPSGFDGRVFQYPQRTSAEDLHQQLRRLPTTLESPYLSEDPNATRQYPPPTTGPAPGSAPSVSLTLQEVMQRVVKGNLDVRVASYNPGIEATRVVEAMARFDPTFFAEAQMQSRFAATAGQTFGDPNNPFAVITTNKDESYVGTLQSGVRQVLPSGGNVELRYRAAHNDNVPARTIIDPFWESELSIQLTQPLLRDFGWEINHARVTIGRLNQHVSLLELRLQVEKSLAEAEQAYWQLQQALREQEIAETLLADTVRTVEILKAREINDVSRLQIAQAVASLEQRRAVLVRVKSQVRELSDTLKRLMNDSELPVAGPQVIAPSTPPALEPIGFDLKDQMDTALRFRAELAQQQLRIDSASVAADVARNNTLPQLDLVAQLAANGVENEWDQSLGRMSEFNRISYGIGFRFEFPLGNRAARAIWQRAMLQRQQAIDQYAALVLQVAEQVKQSHRAVATSWDEMVATRQARFAAAEALKAIESREEKGQEPLTPEFVQLKLDAQSRLADASRQEASATASYNIVIVNLERAKGTLLRYNNVELREDTSVFGLETYKHKPQ